MPKKRRHVNPKQKSKLLSPLLVLGVITLGVAIWYSLPKPQKSNIFEIGAPSGTVSLTLGAPSPTLEINTDSSLTLGYNSSTEHLTAVQVVLNYDPAYITILGVAPGSDFPLAIQAANTSTAGVIKFAYGSAADSGGLLGSGTVATISFKAIKAGNTSITFAEQTMTATTEHGSTNSLQSVANPTLTITETVVDPSTPASAEPSTPASANPSTEPSITPSTPASSQPSIIPSTPASPEKPAKPTGLRSNCFDGGNKITLRWDSVSGVSSYKLRLDQKDGDDDKSIDNIAKTEYDLNIIPDKKYSWWVHSTKNGIDSEEAKVNEVICTKTSTTTSTPSPSPSLAASATPTPSKQPITQKITNIFKKSPTPTPTPKVSTTPKPSTSPSTITINPTPVGGLNDIFGSPIASPDSTSSTEPGLFRKIILGWQAFFVRLSELF